MGHSVRCFRRKNKIFLHIIVQLISNNSLLNISIHSFSCCAKALSTINHAVKVMPSLFILGLVAGKAVRKMDTLAFLGECAPAFAVRGCQVKVLTDPQQFYSQLCNRAANSKERIVMSALYLGSSNPSQI